MGRRGALLSLIIAMGLSLSTAVIAFSEQSDRWHLENDGLWYLYDDTRSSNIENSWFKDLDGSWYLLAPEDGHMYAGLVHDTFTDKWYFCQTEHDGWYGRMVSADGSYTVNGISMTLSFNQNHDGTYGAITGGLDSIKNSGIAITEIAGIPETSVNASDSGTGNESPQEGNEPSGESQIDWRVEGDTLIFEGTGSMVDYEMSDEVYFNLSSLLPWREHMDHVNRIEIGEGITSIGNYAFMEFHKVTSVKLPSTLTRIGTESFYMCWLLTYIDIPDSVTAIGNYAFYDCGLKDIHIPSGVTELGEKTFYGTTLENLELPSSLKTIGDDAFMLNLHLKEVVFPDGTESIGQGAFSTCVELEKLTIPASVTVIAPYAFARCDALTDVYYGGTQEMWNALIAKAKEFPVYGDATNEFMPAGIDVTIHFNAN